MIIQFTDVGRNKWSGTIEIPDTNDPEVIAEAAYRIAKTKLASRYPETIYNIKTNEGTIETGFHKAGTFKVVK